jgi:hypothetical protein
MPGFVRSPATPHALDAIKRAILWAREHRLPLRLTDSFGVVCTSQHALAMWEPDPRARGISPLGACVLQVQPQTVDTDEAASLAVGAPVAWVEGFAAGCARLDASKAWTESVARAQYLAGFAAGTMARAFVMRAEVVNVPPTGQVS